VYCVACDSSMNYTIKLMASHDAKKFDALTHSDSQLISRLDTQTSREFILDP
jgi:hypothetical protein